MNYRLINWLIGYDRYCILGKGLEKAVERLVAWNVPFWDLRITGEGELCFFASSLLRGRLRALCRQVEGEVRVYRLGLPRWICLYRKRWGALVGALLFALLLSFSASRVWEIRVVDGELDEELKEKFSQAGLCEGIAAEAFDSSRFASSFLSANEEYSYVSAGIHGGVAVVWLHPREVPPPAEKNTGGANLVAGEDGEILYCEASYGQVMVTRGEAVQKGQLLVSGIVENKSGGFRLESASGRVLARVNRELEVRVPYSSVEKVYESGGQTRTGIQILGKNINFFSFYGKNQEFCDTIDIVEEFTPFLGLRLPLRLIRRTYLSYRMETVYYTVEEATRLAYDEYYRILGEEAGVLEIVGEELRLEREENGVKLCASLCLVTDIAQKQEITVGELVLPSPEKG